jgi:MFS transporter, DHA1 family, solute carrier family 18 (vesicular amine transporter), member 1/2
MGGILYSRLGYRAPFIFGEVCTILDLFGRLLIIECKDLRKWQTDPSSISTNTRTEEPRPDQTDTAEDKLEAKYQSQSMATNSPVPDGISENAVAGEALSNAEPTLIIRAKPLSLHVVVIRLMKSSRALVALCLGLVWGYCKSSLFTIFVYTISRFTYSSQETTLPLHLQAVWNLNSSKVGTAFLAAVVPTIICMN